MAARGVRSDLIFLDPDYNSRYLRETLAAIVECFPHALLVGHDWLWHGLRREVSETARETGRRLDANGNVWQLATVARPTSLLPVASKNGHNGKVPSLRETKESSPLAPREAIHLAERDGYKQNGYQGVPLAEQEGYKRNGDLLRILATIPHYFRPESSRLYGSGTDRREARIASVRACLASLYGTVAGEDYAVSLARPENLRANAATGTRLEVVICTSGEDHPLDESELAAFAYERRSVRGDPRFLGYACHEVLRHGLGEFDYYGFTRDWADWIDVIDHRAGSTPGSGTLLAGYDYTRDAGNRLTGMDILPDGSNSLYNYGAEDVFTFTYDLRNQLKTADRTDTSADESYTYDDNGNRVTEGTTNYTVVDNNRLQSDGTHSYTYDDEGNRSTRTELATGAVTEYTWDTRAGSICRRRFRRHSAPCPARSTSGTCRRFGAGSRRISVRRRAGVRQAP